MWEKMTYIMTTLFKFAKTDQFLRFYRKKNCQKIMVLQLKQSEGEKNAGGVVKYAFYLSRRTFWQYIFVKKKD